MMSAVLGRQIEGTTRIAGASEVTRQSRPFAWTRVHFLGKLADPGWRVVRRKGVAGVAVSWPPATVLDGCGGSA